MAPGNWFLSPRKTRRILGKAIFGKYNQRFGRRQSLEILSRILSDDPLVALNLPGYPAPIYLRPRTSDVPVFEDIFVQEGYNVQYLLPGFDPGLIVDGGSNVGYSAVYLGRKFPQARILAVEPEPGNYEMLCRNIDAYPNITPVQAAIWDRNTPVEIINEDAEPWAFSVKESPSAHSGLVRAVTITELLAMAAEPHTDLLLKLDIEGAEKKLFEGDFEPWLSQVRMVIIELHDKIEPGCSRAFYRAIVNYPFRQHVRGERVVIIK